MATNGSTGYNVTPIELNGTWFQLRFDMNALVALERELGVNIAAFTPENLGFSGLRAMLWASMLHERPNLKIHDVGDMLDPYLRNPAGLGELVAAVGRAFAAAFPRPSEEAAASPNVQKAVGTGQPSN